MRLDMSNLVTCRGRDRLQRADLVGDQIFDLRGLQAGNRTAAEAMQVAIARMRAHADAVRLSHLYRLAHDVGIPGMEAAGDVDRCGKLDHRGIMAHFPGAKALAEIAV